MINLSEFASYLGTGVKVQYQDFIEDEIDGLVPVLKVRELEVFNFAYSFHYDKLLLRPISDINKTITHSRETFIPLERINEINESACNYSIQYYLESTKELPYWIVRQLEIWWFDTGKLIEQGKAIDINTLDI